MLDNVTNLLSTLATDAEVLEATTACTPVSSVRQPRPHQLRLQPQQQQQQQQQQQPHQQRPLTVHVLQMDGSVVGVHRTIRGASVHAWRLALSDPEVPRLRIETWGVSGIDGVAPHAADTWELDVAGAADLLLSEPAKRTKWLEELCLQQRVPRALWSNHMLQPFLSGARGARA